MEDQGAARGIDGGKKKSKGIGWRKKKGSDGGGKGGKLTKEGSGEKEENPEESGVVGLLQKLEIWKVPSVDGMWQVS